MLQANNISINFSGLKAVNNATLEVADNVICGLIGPNGAGKTTFFNIISGVYKPASGNVIFNGGDITGNYPYHICEKGMTRTYQTIRLFKEMTILENVLVGLHSKMSCGLISSVLRTKKQKQEEYQAKEKAAEILHFIDPFLCDNRSTVSGGLSYGKQRLLEIARALICDPKMLLLDEPAAGMNTTEKLVLMDTINKVKNIGVTVLLVEHDMKLVMEISDYVYVLDHGQMIADGTPCNVQKNPEVIRAYLGGEVE